ncbi:hypothetical protein SS50377_23020 [Spironucleus salmonicida]|uniref:Uncharacterized protein n=1 Tax=Spironucleus salmonicida TaxID=348837 RepID=A0A9P8RZV3_9EUKA|nr:hypothetical protein SS50377_23020 [Spironucleus salmonicida]
MYHKLPNYTNTFYSKIESKPQYFSKIVYPENEQEYKNIAKQEQKQVESFNKVSVKMFKFKRPSFRPIQNKEICEMEKFVDQISHKKQPIPSLKSFSINRDIQPNSFYPLSARRCKRQYFDYQTDFE